MTFLRSALFNIWFYALTFIATILGMLAFLVSPSWLKRVEREWARANLGALRLICGIRIKIVGLELLPPGAIIIASQHQSAFDTFIWMVLVPHASYVLKQELTRIPLFGGLLTRLGHIPVDRKAGAAALRGLLHDGAATLALGRQVVIFPEGTRVAAGERGVLQPGVAALASHTNAIIVPVATDSGFCWGRNAFVKRPGTIHLVIRPPLPTDLRRPALLAAIQTSWDEGQEIIRAICG